MADFVMKPTLELKSERNLNIMQQAQKYVDSECIRRMDKYTKRDTGALIKSATTQTTIGSGKIIQRTPYARKQYYTLGVRNNDTGLRGTYWFQRMASAEKGQILRGLEKITGGKAK